MQTKLPYMHDTLSPVTKLRRYILETTTDDGENIVLITLPDGREAIVEPEMFEMLVREGYSCNWRITVGSSGGEYVVAKRKGSPRNCAVSLARVIMKCPKNQAVRFRHSTLDLRRSNLQVVPKEFQFYNGKRKQGTEDSATVGRKPSGKGTRREADPSL